MATVDGPPPAYTDPPDRYTHRPAGPAEKLLSEHRAACNDKMNARAANQLGHQIVALLRQGYTPPDIRAGLLLWREKSWHPDELPDIVDYAHRKKTQRHQQRQQQHRDNAAQQRRTAGGRNPNPFLEHLRRAAEHNQPRREIGGGT